jgi:hypothetical protein
MVKLNLSLHLLTKKTLIDLDTSFTTLIEQFNEAVCKKRNGNWTAKNHE